MTARWRRARGFTLLEVLAYCLVLAAIVNLCTSLFLSVRRIHALGSMSVTRMDALREMESDFRRAAHNAQAVTAGVDGLDLPGLALTLRGPAKDGAMRYAVWRMGEKNALIHETYESRDSTTAILGQKSYPIGVREFRPSASHSPGNVIEIAIIVENKGTSGTIPAANTFVARLGGGA
jgi:type II secretory pathway component PulJ